MMDCPAAASNDQSVRPLFCIVVMQFGSVAPRLTSRQAAYRMRVGTAPTPNRML
jgi:hypothetical protein